MKSIAVLIPTHNRQKNWSNYLKLAQMKNIDVYILDNSDEKSVADSSFIYTYLGKSIGKQVALDAWVPLKEYDFVVEMDDDFIIDYDLFINEMEKLNPGNYYVSDWMDLDGNVMGDKSHDGFDSNKFYLRDGKNGDKLFFVPFKEYIKFKYDVEPGEKFIYEDYKWVRMFKDVKMLSLKPFIKTSFNNNGYTQNGVPFAPLSHIKRTNTILKVGNPAFKIKCSMLYNLNKVIKKQKGKNIIKPKNIIYIFVGSMYNFLWRLSSKWKKRK